VSRTSVVAHDALLVRRARYGDRRAARRLAARHLDRAALLASAVGTTREGSAQLAREGFAMAVRSRRPFDEALVMTFASLAAAAPDADAARSRLLVLLVDLEQRPAAEVGALLGLEPAEVRALLTRARRGTGSTYAGRSCRGWGLVSRAGLTPAERQAGLDHLALCRRCRDRQAALDRARQEQLTRAAGVTGLVVVAELGAAAVPTAAGVGTLVVGKAAVGVIGALGAAVLATAGAVAATGHSPSRPGAPAPAPAVIPGGAVPARTGPSPTASPGPCGTRCAPAGPAPTKAGDPLLRSVPLSTSLPSSPLPAPSLLKLPLSPTGLPLSPTSLPLPIPLPTVQVTLLPLP